MGNKIYAILDTSTNEFVSFNSKCAWSKAGNAKNAFGCHMPRDRNYEQQRFDEQERHKLIELTEYFYANAEEDDEDVMKGLEK